MKIVALILAQSVALGFGEERQSKVWRTWAPRWDVYVVQVEYGPFVVDLSHKRGVCGLNPDRKFPTASVGIQWPDDSGVEWRPGGRLFVDFGHIQGPEEAPHLTPAAGLWVYVPIRRLMWLNMAAYLRGHPRVREYRGEQSLFRAHARIDWRWKGARR